MRHWHCDKPAIGTSERSVGRGGVRQSLGWNGVVTSACRVRLKVSTWWQPRAKRRSRPSTRSFRLPQRTQFDPCTEGSGAGPTATSRGRTGSERGWFYFARGVNATTRPSVCAPQRVSRAARSTRPPAAARPRHRSRPSARCVRPRRPHPTTAWPRAAP